MDTKCESALGYAIESALGERTCDVGAVYVLTIKTATSELFFYRLDPDDGTEIYKINLFTEVLFPSTVNTTAWSRIRVDSSGTHVYINRGTFLTKVKTGIDVPLNERVVWDVLTAGGQGDLSLPFDGDPRWGASRYDKDTGANVWGSPGQRWNSVGFDSKLHIAVTSVTAGNSLPIQQLDTDGNVDWTHLLPQSISGACGDPAVFVLGIGTTVSGQVWVGWTFQLCVASNLRNRYRERLLDTDGTFFLGIEAGEAPSIRGRSNFLVATPSKTQVSWLYTIFPATRRIKRIADSNAEIDTTALTAAQFPTILLRGNTGTYLKKSGDFVTKTDNILTTDIWTAAIDASLDSGQSVWIGAKD